MIHVVRTGRVTGPHGAGVLGHIHLGPLSLFCIENEVTPRLVPIGKYRAEMGLMRDGQRRAIRLLPPVVKPEAVSEHFWRSFSAGRIYIHPANYPDQLDGCIAPGESLIPGGVGRSAAAMESLFLALGGWNPGQFLEVEIHQAMR